uniref:Phosphatidylinositol transfer protein N-terminal domain-containing protein n=1 Tax=Ditylenchus dipsaci TaxID=166011 RepID=A0A915DHQ0_9BILA
MTTPLNWKSIRWDNCGRLQRPRNKRQEVVKVLRYLKTSRSVMFLCLVASSPRDNTLTRFITCNQKYQVCCEKPHQKALWPSMKKPGTPTHTAKLSSLIPTTWGTIFFARIETIHLNDRGTTENAHGLSQEMLAKREVVNINIANDHEFLNSSDLKPETSPSLVMSAKTGRGKLDGNWRERYFFWFSLELYVA